MGKVVSTRLIQIYIGINAGPGDTWQKSYGIPRPAATFSGPEETFGGAGFQGVTRVQLPEFTRLK